MPIVSLYRRHRRCRHHKILSCLPVSLKIKSFMSIVYNIQLHCIIYNTIVYTWVDVCVCVCLCVLMMMMMMMMMAE